MELADKMSFPSMAVTVDVNVVLFFSSIAIKKKNFASDKGGNSYGKYGAFCYDLECAA